MPSTVPVRPTRVLVNFLRPRVRKKFTRTRLRGGLHTHDTVRKSDPSRFSPVHREDALDERWAVVNTVNTPPRSPMRNRKCPTNCRAPARIARPRGERLRQRRRRQLDAPMRRPTPTPRPAPKRRPARRAGRYGSARRHGRADGTAAASGDTCVDGDTVKLGFLNSTSGPMAISEQTVRDSLMLAADEINADGGIMGKQIEFIEEDGQSEPTDLRREDQQAAHRGQGRRRVRRLDLGLPQGDAARGRRRQRPALLPGPVRGPRGVEEHLLHRCDDQPADHPGHGLPRSRRA